MDDIMRGGAGGRHTTGWCMYEREKTYQWIFIVSDEVVQHVCC